MTNSINIGATAPESYVMVVSAGNSGIDLSTVTAVSLKVKRYDGSLTTWAATRSEQTATSIKLTHVMALIDLTTPGQYIVTGILTVPSGTVRSKPVILYVKDEFDAS